MTKKFAVRNDERATDYTDTKNLKIRRDMNVAQEKSERGNYVPNNCFYLCTTVVTFMNKRDFRDNQTKTIYPKILYFCELLKFKFTKINIFKVALVRHC